MNWKRLLLFVVMLGIPAASYAQTSKIPQQCVGSGSATAQTCTTLLVFTPSVGDVIIFTPGTTNTGDMTLGINSGTAYHLRKWQASSVLASGDAPAGIPIIMAFDGTYWEVTSIGNAPSSGGSAASPTYSVQYNNSGPFGGTTAPSANGQYDCGYTITGAVAAAPTCPQVGLGSRALTGSTTGLTVAYSDNATRIDHDVAATGTGAITLPTATTLGNTNFAFSYCNFSPQTDVITPTTWTIAASSTLSVLPNTCYGIWVDPNSSTNWLASSGSGGSTPCTTTNLSVQYDNSGVFGCFPDFTFSTPHTLLAGASGLVDLHSEASGGLRIPVAAGATSASDGSIDYDSTNKNTHVRTNGADSIVAAEASAIAAGFLPEATNATQSLLKASLCDNGITTTNVFTCSDTAGAAFVAVKTGTSPPTCTAGSAGSQCNSEGSTGATGASGVDDFDAISPTHTEDVNNNNTGDMPISRAPCVNVTPVTVAANVTTDQNLQACTLSANTLNVVGHTLKVYVAGNFSTATASTASLTFKVKFCTVSGCGSGTVISPITTTTGATTALTASSLFFSQTSLITTQTAGASSAYEAHGSLLIDLSATAATPDSSYGDTNTTTVGTIDSTGAIYLQVTVAASAGSTSNSFTERQLVVELIN